MCWIDEGQRNWRWGSQTGGSFEITQVCAGGHLEPVSGSVRSCCRNKIQQTGKVGVASATEIKCLIVSWFLMPEDWNRSIGGDGAYWGLWGTSDPMLSPSFWGFLVIPGVLWLIDLPPWSLYSPSLGIRPLCLCFQTSCLIRISISYIGLGPTLMTSCELDSFRQTLSPKRWHCEVLRVLQVLDSNTAFMGGHNWTHNRQWQWIWREVKGF